MPRPREGYAYRPAASSRARGGRVRSWGPTEPGGGDQASPRSLTGSRPRVLRPRRTDEEQAELVSRRPPSSRRPAASLGGTRSLF
jgi:hypothetical protein